MVVTVLRRSHFHLKAQHLGAIFTKGAVHVGITPQHVVNPFLEGGQHLRMVPQVGGMEDLQIGMVGGHPLAVLHDATHQHTGEQKVGKHHDAAIAQFDQLAQPGFDQGEGHPRVEGLSPAESEALYEHAGDLGHVGVGIGIGGTTAHHHQQGVVEGHRLSAGPAVLGIRLLQTATNPGCSGQDHLAIHPEFAAVINAQARFSCVGVQHRRDVVFGVARCKQHGWNRQYMADAPAAQGLEPVAQDRSGEFEVAKLHGNPPHQLLQLAGQGSELLHR